MLELLKDKLRPYTGSIELGPRCVLPAGSSSASAAPAVGELARFTMHAGLLARATGLPLRAFWTLQDAPAGAGGCCPAGIRNVSLSVKPLF